MLSVGRRKGPGGYEAPAGPHSRPAISRIARSSRLTVSRPGQAALRSRFASRPPTASSGWFAADPSTRTRDFAASVLGPEIRPDAPRGHGSLPRAALTPGSSPSSSKGTPSGACGSPIGTRRSFVADRTSRKAPNGARPSYAKDRSLSRSTSSPVETSAWAPSLCLPRPVFGNPAERLDAPAMPIVNAKAVRDLFQFFIPSNVDRSLGIRDERRPMERFLLRGMHLHLLNCSPIQEVDDSSRVSPVRLLVDVEDHPPRLPGADRDDLLEPEEGDLWIRRESGADVDSVWLFGNRGTKAPKHGNVVAAPVYSFFAPGPAASAARSTLPKQSLQACMCAAALSWRIRPSSTVAARASMSFVISAARQGSSVCHWVTRRSISSSTG